MIDHILFGREVSPLKSGAVETKRDETKFNITIINVAEEMGWDCMVENVNDESIRS